jgi:hypothetical protein
MPDDDRFERRLRGKGWRSVYRLACSGPIETVADKILGAATHVFRNEPIQCVREMYNELGNAVAAVNGTLFHDEIRRQAFEQLSSSLERIVADDGHSEISRVAQRAVLRTLAELEERGGVTDDMARQQFTRNLVFELSERRCLSAVRDGIMETSGREKQTQLEWESEVRNTLLGPCGALSRSLLGATDSRSIRAPNRLVRPRPTTIETLNQPLVRGEAV